MDDLTVEVMFSLGFVFHRRQPLACMRVLYCSCVFCVFSKRETNREIVRENRGYYSRSAVGCVSSFCWIIERKDWLFGVDIAQIR